MKFYQLRPPFVDCRGEGWRYALTTAEGRKSMLDFGPGEESEFADMALGIARGYHPAVVAHFAGPLPQLVWVDEDLPDDTPLFVDGDLEQRRTVAEIKAWAAAGGKWPEPED